jgi:hypothetical protein
MFPADVKSTSKLFSSAAALAYLRLAMRIGLFLAQALEGRPSLTIGKDYDPIVRFGFRREEGQSTRGGADRRRMTWQGRVKLLSEKPKQTQVCATCEYESQTNPAFIRFNRLAR